MGAHRPTPGSDLDEVRAVRTAGLGARLGARLLDVLVVYLPISLLLAIVGAPAPTLGLGGVSGWSIWLVSVATALVWLSYCVVLEANGGATVGKRLLGLRVTGDDGGDPSLRAATLRNLWIVVGPVPLVGGVAQLAAIVTIAVTTGRSPEDRGLHDRLAGTTVLARSGAG